MWWAIDIQTKVRANGGASVTEAMGNAAKAHVVHRSTRATQPHTPHVLTTLRSQAVSV